MKARGLSLLYLMIAASCGAVLIMFRLNIVIGKPTGLLVNLLGLLSLHEIPVFGTMSPLVLSLA